MWREAKTADARRKNGGAVNMVERWRQWMWMRRKGIWKEIGMYRYVEEKMLLKFKG